jgi:anti-anti-sigma factor
MALGKGTKAVIPVGFTRSQRTREIAARFFVPPIRDLQAIMWRFCGLDSIRRGLMRMSLETREVGRVTIVRCNGRIVAGSESESLRSHVTWLLRDRRAIVLHLGEVGLIDSSGLGTIVRSLTSTRQVHGDLKLCNVPEHVRKVLEL